MFDYYELEYLIIFTIIIMHSKLFQHNYKAIYENITFYNHKWKQYSYKNNVLKYWGYNVLSPCRVWWQSQLIL
jgi:hypothetical protein